MIHIIIGTKAQFIKMAPVMKGLESKGVPYNFINLGQHGETVSKLLRQFQIQDSRFKIQGSGTKDVSSVFGILKWLAGHLMMIAFRPRYLRESIFKGGDGITLIHGDTLSTLIGLLMVKRAGLKVAHVESGLRSWNYFHPFPEEMIRVICMRYSDYLFAPSGEAVENLKKMGVKGKVFNTGGNTGMDAVKAVVSQEAEVRSQKSEATANVSRLTSHVQSPYVLVSIHRFENLYSRKRFRFILDTVDEVSKRFNVIFVMHGPTERRLGKAGVRGQYPKGHKGPGVSHADHRPPTTDHSVTYLPLQDYPTFLSLIKGSEFVITDGGSVQEECSYLGKPCLIMRKRTERDDGIGKNAVVCNFNKGVIGVFIRDHGKYKKPVLVHEKIPSVLIVEEATRL